MGGVRGGKSVAYGRRGGCPDELVGDASLPAGGLKQDVQAGLPQAAFRNLKGLLIRPDHTRCAPVGQMFKEVHAALGSVAKQIDVMVALGTHPPMSQEAICHRLDLTLAEKEKSYPNVRLLNHAWDDDKALVEVGNIPSRETRGGR